MQTLLSTKNISCELSDRTLFKASGLSIARGERIGLVGKNGSGKSTLLKILAGMQQPSTGTVETFGTVQYLPQLDFALFERAENIETFLASRNVSWPLVHASLDRLFGATAIKPEKEVRTLSGGELAKLLIATADVRNPDILLLDEPTNHLDIEGLEVSKQYLLAFKGACIVVSHDPFFLDQVVTSLWEISNASITRFGGTYSKFQEQKQLADTARERDLEAAQKEVKKARRAIKAREIRAARAARADRRSKAEPSRDKFAEGYFKGRSEQSAGRLKRQQDKMMVERKDRVQELQKPKLKIATVSLAAGEERSKRMLVTISKGSLFVGDKALLFDTNFRVEFGDRIALAGKNGSGKSSFAKVIARVSGAYRLEGSLKKSDTLKVVYLDQKYQAVDPEKSLLANVQQANPHLDESMARGLLGKFLFGTDVSIQAPAKMLSGGETARLALAQATSQPIDLLVLDEPTNNLDIETLDIIAEALEDFRGAIIVISHNVHFLAQLGIARVYVLTGKRLKEMNTLPENAEEFYCELARSE